MASNNRSARAREVSTQNEQIALLRTKLEVALLEKEQVVQKNEAIDKLRRSQ